AVAGQADRREDARAADLGRLGLAVEGAGFHQGFDDLAVHLAAVDALAEVEEGLEGAGFVAGGADDFDGAFAYAFDGAEAEADGAADARGAWAGGGGGGA